MLREAIRLAGLTASVLVAVPPASQSSPYNGDLECLVAVTQLTASNDEAAKSAGLLGSMFFAGKIFGAQPDIDLDQSLLQAAKRIKPEQISSLLKRCGSEMQERGDQIQAAGRFLSSQGS